MSDRPLSDRGEPTKSWDPGRAPNRPLSDNEQAAMDPLSPAERDAFEAARTRWFEENVPDVIDVSEVGWIAHREFAALRDPSEEERLREALKAIAGPEDRGYWVEQHYQPAGGGYEGLQAIARAALAARQGEGR